MGTLIYIYITIKFEYFHLRVNLKFCYCCAIYYFITDFHYYYHHPQCRFRRLSPRCGNVVEIESAVKLR